MEEACASYIMLDGINKWLIQKEGFIKMTWTIILTEGPEWRRDIGSMHVGEVITVAITEERFRSQLANNFQVWAYLRIVSFILQCLSCLFSLNRLSNVKGWVYTLLCVDICLRGWNFG